MVWSMESEVVRSGALVRKSDEPEWSVRDGVLVGGTVFNFASLVILLI
jgi:hypothetical protein